MCIWILQWTWQGRDIIGNSISGSSDDEILVKKFFLFIEHSFPAVK